MNQIPLSQVHGQADNEIGDYVFSIRKSTNDGMAFIPLDGRKIEQQKHPILFSKMNSNIVLGEAESSFFTNTLTHKAVSPANKRGESYFVEVNALKTEFILKKQFNGGVLNMRVASGLNNIVVHDLCCSRDGQHIYLLYHAGETTLFLDRSNDGGMTWSKQVVSGGTDRITNQQYDRIWSVKCSSNGQDVVIVGNDLGRVRVFNSNNYGASVIMSPMSDTQPQNISSGTIEVSISDDLKKIAVVVYSTVTYSRYLRLSVNGLQFVDHSIETSLVPNSTTSAFKFLSTNSKLFMFYSSSSSNGLYYQNVIFESFDDAISWTKLDIPPLKIPSDLYHSMLVGGYLPESSMCLGASESGERIYIENMTASTSPSSIYSRQAFAVLSVYDTQNKVHKIISDSVTVSVGNNNQSNVSLVKNDKNQDVFQIYHNGNTHKQLSVYVVNIGKYLDNCMGSHVPVFVIADEVSEHA